MAAQAAREADANLIAVSRRASIGAIKMGGPMRYRVAVLLLFTFLGGCTGPSGQTFSVPFGPYSANLDPPAQEIVRAAAAFAKAHSLMPLSIAGYTIRPDPDYVDTLREQRVAAVRRALVTEGVGEFRIQVLGTGIVYPQGVPMPSLPPGRVDINIGL